MKKLISILLVIIVTNANGQEDYVMQINDTAFNISTNKKYELVVNGRKLNFTVRLKDTLSYIDELYTFLYPKDFKVTKSKIGEGIEQIMLMTAEGSGVLIQKYSTLEPT